MADKNLPIGVFDSGVGGISVLRQLQKLLPREQFLYYGDAANAPYGTRSTQQVQALTMAAAAYLVNKGIKALVVACNTATAASITTLRETYPELIVVGIEPALKLAADHFPSGTVGVLATPVTLREEKFSRLAQQFPRMQVESIPLPGLVERIEAGCDQATLEAFLRPALASYHGKLDAAVLGCTHYPFAQAAIGVLLGPNTALLDGSEGTARETRRRLEHAGLLSDGPGGITLESSSNDEEFLARCQALLAADSGL